MFIQLQNNAIRLVLIAGVMFTYGHYQYSRGYEKASQHYDNLAQEEATRQEEIHNQLKAEYEEVEERLQNRLIQKDREIEELLKEAEQDPYSGRTAISGDSVRRLNRID